MSYCRIGKDSSIYLYRHATTGNFVCGLCALSGFCGAFEAKTKEEMIEHLNDHVKNGDLVPEYAFSRLRDKENY